MNKNVKAMALFYTLAVISLFAGVVTLMITFPIMFGGLVMFVAVSYLVKSLYDLILLELDLKYKLKNKL